MSAKRLSLRQRLTATLHHLDAADLEAEIEQRNCCPLAQVRRGEPTTVTGRLRAVVYTPSERVPTLSAELFDGTDSLELVWFGRRRIAGIEPGRRLVVRGRVGERDGHNAMFNPWYELQPAG